nr:hypothetical protein [uncultured Sphingomonas sp.]
MRDAVVEGLALAEHNFSKIENAIAPARVVPWEGTYNWRFTEQSVDQLLIQKLARQISGVKAADILLLSGRLQEIGVLYRMMDEICDDILFIVLGVVTGKWGDVHDSYVSYFWSETGDVGPPYRRKAIRAFINRALDQENPSDADKNDRLLHSTFSDFVHARSHPIMGMVSGPPPRFDLSPIFDDVAVGQFAKQQPFYAYRCLMSAATVARIVLDDAEQANCYRDFKGFEHRHLRLILPASA